MKHIAFHRKLAEFPINDLEAENTLLRAYAADSCDDRVSEDIFDVEDKYAEVAIIKSCVARSP